MNAGITRSELQESFVKLFLRLNGYLTTGNIIHSSEERKNMAQIDIVAARFPHHSQRDVTTVDSCEYLQIPKDTIDIIIGEVKGGSKYRQFNRSIRENADAVKKLVEWIGMVEPIKTDKIVEWLIEELKPNGQNNPDHFSEYKVSNQYTVRPIIFRPDIPEPAGASRIFVPGGVMLEYVWKCLRPKEKRETCSTDYQLNLWGHDLSFLVEYFKQKDREEVGTMEQLYKNFSV